MVILLLPVEALLLSIITFGKIMVVVFGIIINVVFGIVIIVVVNSEDLTLSPAVSMTIIVSGDKDSGPVIREFR